MYADPQSSQGWQDVALERRSDAATLYAGQRSVGTLYFLGFVAESYAKALCIASGKIVPKGHNIIDILEKAGVKRTDLPPKIRKFAEERDVSLRYQVTLPLGVDFSAEFACAQRLTQWCATRLNRPTRRRR